MTEELKSALEEKDKEIARLRQLIRFQEGNDNQKAITDPVIIHDSFNETKNTKLSNEEISRYSRQLILPEFGVKGQLSLKNTSVLIVGAGGLGCPSAIYLAAAGIGRLGVVDYDEVELSNLHRQVLHTEARVGSSKSVSVTQSCRSLNARVEYIPFQVQLDSSNALQIVSRFDIVLDATDNVATRYLLNDACVLAGKPLISGSALRFEGQLTVYNYEGGPCYRCLFPQPPPPETVTNCSEGGVVGVVPGIIGSLQALEAIKIAAGLGTSFQQRLLLFDAVDGTFRTPKLRPRSVECCVCGDHPTLTQLVDYEQFCGSRAADKYMSKVWEERAINTLKRSGEQMGEEKLDKDLHLLGEQNRMNAKDYARLLKEESPHVLVDVRSAVEVDICRLPHPALNLPLSCFLKDVKAAASEIQNAVDQKLKESESNSSVPVVFVCRRGNDSQRVVQILQRDGQLSGLQIRDIRRGLYGWTKQVDPEFPLY